MTIKSRRLILPQHGEPVNDKIYWCVKIQCLACVKKHLTSYRQLDTIGSIYYLRVICLVVGLLPRSTLILPRSLGVRSVSIKGATQARIPVVIIALGEGYPGIWWYRVTQYSSHRVF